MDDTSGGWGDALLNGLSAVIDSQRTQNYAVSNPNYNTAGGTGGQSQAVPAGAITSNTLVLIGGVLAIALVIFLALRK
jgi:hypothetical protein